MAIHTFCNNKFRLDDPHVVDPRADSPWSGIQRSDLAQVIADGFAEPVDFPPIPQAVLAEDKIAIAVEPDTPCGLEIARLVAERFVEQGNPRENITILCAEQDGDAGTDHVVHDPADTEQMAYLLADQEGLPHYVNRHLFDADIVVPIGTGDGGRRSNALCPAFCDEMTRKQLERMNPEQAAALERMIDSNLGVFWQIRIVTAPGDEVLQVMVGCSESVLQKSGQFGTEVWNLQIERPADLVVATIESSCCQTWSHLRRAILNADKVGTDDAAIVLCTELRGKPPVSWPTPDRSARKADKDLDDVFQRRHVYLASRLTQDSTEKFGFGYVQDSSQIQKLIDQHKTCLLLRDAHRVELHHAETADHG